MVTYEKPLYILVFITLLIILSVALLKDGLVKSFEGFLLLQTHPARLISDFTVIGGVGGALMNAFVLGTFALLLVRFNDIRLSGPTIAGIFTIVGFSLFGKTPLNALPIMGGVFLAGKAMDKPFKNYMMFALFGTALGPLVTFLIAEAGLSGFPAIASGIIGGAIAGFLLPALAMAMLRMHEGFNLYNIGLTSGFLGLFIGAILVSSGRDVEVKIIWNQEKIPELIYLFPLLCLFFILWGIVTDGGNTLKNLKRIYKQTGRLPSDFMESGGPGAALVNAGLLGLAGSLYLFLIGADFNGPVLGGLFTVLGFATFGKHPRNCWSVSLGVVGATLLFGKSLCAPGPVLAFLFATTLAPLAGEFGPFIGLAAGFLHLTLVEQTAAWHGGLDLYNNGFSGGLTVTFMVALIQWARSKTRTK